MSDYKKDELLEKASELGLNVDKRIKKDDLIELIENKEKEVDIMTKDKKEEIVTKTMNIYEKINRIKQDICEIEFCLDTPMPSSLGGKDYASIGQYYRAINDLSIKYNLLFIWNVDDILNIEREIFKPQGKMPQHVATVKCYGIFINIDNPEEKVVYTSVASGSDSCDKYTSAANSMAFRNWFDKNFTPKHLTVDEYYNDNNEVSETTEQTQEPKIPTYIPPEKKVELTKEVVNEKQIVSDEEIQNVISKIMKVRELSSNDEWGANTLQSLINGDVSSEDLMELELKIDNKLDSLGGNE